MAAVSHGDFGAVPRLTEAAIKAAAERALDTAESQSESSELSSVPSMGRQISEFSDAQCMETMSRQCSGFQQRGSEFWLRQSTMPANAMNSNVMEGMKRQLSCPSGPSPGGPLRKIPDEESCTSTPKSSRQVSSQAGASVDEGLIESAIHCVVSDCNFSVCIADPYSFDTEMVAVSEGFVRLTGYQREEVIGENCRILNRGLPIAPEIRKRMSETIETGTPFTGVIMNRRKDGTLFLNLLDMRGLVIARNHATGDDLYVLIAVQQDVTGMRRSAAPESNAPIMNQVASRIRKRLLKQLGQLGLSGALGQLRFNPAKRKDGKQIACTDSKSHRWHLVMEASWKPGELAPQAVKRSLEYYPENVTSAGLAVRLEEIAAKVLGQVPPEARRESIEKNGEHQKTHAGPEDAVKEAPRSADRGSDPRAFRNSQRWLAVSAGSVLVLGAAVLVQRFLSSRSAIRRL